MKKVICPICTSSESSFVETRDEFTIFRCRNCEAEFCTPLFFDEHDVRNERVYETRAQGVGSFLGWCHEAFFRIVPKTKSVLEVGCGTGDFVAEAVRRGYGIEGVDLSVEAIEVGRRHFGAIPIHAKSAHDFFAHHKKRYDVIAAFEVLEHVTDPIGFVSEMASYLAPGGHIILSTPNNDSPLLKVWRRVTRIVDYPPHHVWRWSKKAIHVVAEKSGLRVEKIQPSQPSLSDIASDWIKLNLSDQRPVLKKRIVRAMYLIFRPIDFVICHTIREGRGMIIVLGVKP